MQPPLHFTGELNADWLIFIGGATVSLYWLRALRLARDGVRLFLHNLAVVILIFLVSELALAELRIPSNNALLMSGLVALTVFFSRKRAVHRSRYIPASVKRAVIARDLKGERYNPAKHHIDHVWPFSKGGSNTIDNLRVIEKKENLKKRAKRPRMREIW
jgi:5-methylcytosine-specific restriction endonuclease McrA